MAPTNRTIALALLAGCALIAASAGFLPHCSALNAPARAQLEPQIELVQVVESGGPLGWRGVERASQLARESQVVAVHFGQLAGDLSARLDDAVAAGNKTKQSQEFELGHQQKPAGSTPPIGLPAGALTTASPATAAASEASAATTAATATTTTTTTTTTTPEASTTPPATSEAPLPVGSKVEREGAAVLCGEANANGKSNKRLISDRIVGGYKTEPGEFPFQVRLNIHSRRGSGICGGVVLDRWHILTAAHCMTACASQHLTTATIENAGVRATIGDHSIKANDGEQELEVASITPHEKYDACNFYANDHDIALIKTAAPIQFRFTTDGYGSINRPCMPTRRDLVYAEGEQAIVSGWGVTRENSGALSNILRYVQVPLVNVSRCQETYGSRVTQEHVCAGFQAGGKDSCQGDSGGPLVRVVDNRYELVGIVSFGYGCGQPGAPGVYTRVASYLDWIQANL